MLDANPCRKTTYGRILQQSSSQQTSSGYSVAKVEFKQIRPSRTKKQRDDLKKACDLKQANGQASSTDGENKYNRADDIHYFHPRSDKLAAGSSSASGESSGAPSKPMQTWGHNAHCKSIENGQPDF